MDIFSRIENRLKSDYGGRFFCIVLEQVCRAEPELLLTVFPGLKGNERLWKELKKAVRDDLSALQIEVPFEGEENGRRADLYIKLDGRLIALAEVKYEDHKAIGIKKQIEDNIRIAKKADACFSYITKHPPSNEIRKLIENRNSRKSKDRHKSIKTHTCTYRDIYNAAKRLYLKNHNPIINYFCHYMEEKFTMFKENLGDNAIKELTYLMLRGLYIKHRHGFGKHSAAEISYAAFDLAKNLMGNVQSIADEIHDARAGIFNRRPLPNFEFDPEFEIKSAQKTFKSKLDDGDQYTSLKREDRSGGYFVLTSTGIILSEPYIYLSFGLKFFLDVDENKIEMDTFAEVFGKDMEGSFCESGSKAFTPKMSEKTTRAEVLRQLNSAIKKAKDAKNEKGNKLSPAQQRRLGEVYKLLSDL